MDHWTCCRDATPAAEVIALGGRPQVKARSAEGTPGKLGNWCSCCERMIRVLLSDTQHMHARGAVIRRWIFIII